MNCVTNKVDIVSNLSTSANRKAFLSNISMSVLPEALPTTNNTTVRSICRKLTLVSIVIFSIVLLYLFVEEVVPAHEGLHFLQTTCSLNTSQVVDSVVCDCGVYTVSACYPCLEVLVWVNVTASRSSHGRSKQLNRILAKLHDNLYMLSNKCFFKPSRCCHSNKENKKSVASRQTMLRRLDDPFTCYVSPHNSSQVFLHRHPYETIIISCTVLPSIAIMLSLFILVRISAGQEEKQVQIAFGSIQWSSREASMEDYSLTG